MIQYSNYVHGPEGPIPQIDLVARLSRTRLAMSANGAKADNTARGDAFQGASPEGAPIQRATI